MSKKIPVYFSDKSLANLKSIMDEDGKVSPTINRILEAIEDPVLFRELGFVGVESLTKMAIPMTLESIPTGFPSPAADNIDECVDLNTLLINNPNATFLNRIRSESMVDAGLELGDIVVVDRSVQPQHQSIVVALIDNKDLTIKRLMITNQMNQDDLIAIFGFDYKNKQLPHSWLKAENPEFSHIFPSEEQTIKIEAVITWTLKNMLHK